MLEPVAVGVLVLVQVYVRFVIKGFVDVLIAFNVMVEGLHPTTVPNGACKEKVGTGGAGVIVIVFTLLQPNASITLMVLTPVVRLVTEYVVAVEPVTTGVGDQLRV
jgi:hypothetical protein